MLLGLHEVSMPHGRVHMVSYQTCVPDRVTIDLEAWAHEAYAWFDRSSLLATNEPMLWGVPTVLRDFGLLPQVSAADPTLQDGSSVTLLSRLIHT